MSQPVNPSSNSGCNCQLGQNLCDNIKNIGLTVGQTKGVFPTFPFVEQEGNGFFFDLAFWLMNVCDNAYSIFQIQRVRY